MAANSVVDEEPRLSFPQHPADDAPRTSDARLIRRAKRGSSEAVEALVRRHWPKAYRAALLIVQDSFAAEDITQEALLSAVQSLDRFDWRRPMAPWLHRIVVNRSVDYLRDRQRQPEIDGQDNRPDSPVDQFTYDDESRDVAAALQRLEPLDRAIVVLRHLFDYRSREIGSLVGMPAATVRTRLRRAVAELLTALESDPISEEDRQA
jgi:RNA polymerase sigma-70 factor (ECF subfamily)